MISNSLDIDFIRGDIRGRLCKKLNIDNRWTRLSMAALLA